MNATKSNESLIGKHCWTIYHTIREGTIVSKNSSLDIYHIKYLEGSDDDVIPDLIFLTLKDAIEGCQAEIEYWTRKEEELSIRLVFNDSTIIQQDN